MAQVAVKLWLVNLKAEDGSSSSFDRTAPSPNSFPRQSLQMDLKTPKILGNIPFCVASFALEKQQQKIHVQHLCTLTCYGSDDSSKPLELFRKA